MKSNEQEVIIYTDGASRGNPGPGGYAAILISGNHHKELVAGYRLTTNNRMELMAIIAALEALKKKPLSVKIYTDSNYVVNAINKGWLQEWIAKDFKGKKNKDLWIRLWQLMQDHRIEFHWVKGHHQNPYNNRCDQLATHAADHAATLLDEEYEQMLIRENKLTSS